MTIPQIFISYSLKNENIADRIYENFHALGIPLILDKREIEYCKSINVLRKRVRYTDRVIMVISNAFLKSRDCMFGVLEFVEDINYKDCIIPILLDDCKGIYSIKGHTKYVKFWEKELEQAKKIVAKYNPINTDPLYVDLKEIEYIYKNVDSFISYIKNIFHVGLDELQKANYKPLFDKLGFIDETILTELVRISSIADNEEQALAIEEFQEQFGKNEKFYHFNAYLEMKKSNYIESKSCYEEAIRINPNNAKTHNDLANLLCLCLGEYEEAKKHYMEAVRINPDDSKVHYNLAIFLEIYLKDYEGAKKHYMEVVRINPECVEAYNNLGSLLSNDYFKDYEEARKDFEKALSINSKYASAHYNLSFLLEKHFKDSEGAKKHFDEAMRINPEQL